MIKKIPRYLLLLPLFFFSSASWALNETEADDLADLTAIFVYLKHDCGYSELPDQQISRAITFFAHQNKWDLSDYSNAKMKLLNEESYQDLKKIPINNKVKCNNLARESLGLLAYVN